MLIDVTLILKENIPVYPGDPKFEIEKIYSIESSGFNLHRLTMGTHTGTHMEMIYHSLI